MSLSWTSIPSSASSKAMPSVDSAVGGVSPPAPTITGAGSALPDETWLVGEIELCLREVVAAALAAMNSLTVPATLTSRRADGRCRRSR